MGEAALTSFYLASELPEVSELLNSACKLQIAFTQLAYLTRAHLEKLPIELGVIQDPVSNSLVIRSLEVEQISYVDLVALLSTTNSLADLIANLVSNLKVTSCLPPLFHLDTRNHHGCRKVLRLRQGWSQAM